MINKNIQNEEYILQEVIVVKSLRDDKIHYLPKELIDEWLETFELKNLNDDFIPQIKNEIKPLLLRQSIVAYCNYLAYRDFQSEMRDCVSCAVNARVNLLFDNFADLSYL